MSENEHLVRIYDKLDEISKNISSLSERTSLTEQSARTHQDSCRVRHANDGNIGRMVATEAAKFGVLLALALVAMKIGLK